MKLTKLISITCLVAGSLNAHTEQWPWEEEWQSASSILVSNTNDSGEGSFYHAIVTANRLRKPLRIMFGLSKNDPGFNLDRNSWTITVPQELVITSPVWIDGFSQPGSRPNTSKQGSPNNARWAIDFEGADQATPGSYGFRFMREAEGSRWTGTTLSNFLQEAGYTAAVSIEADDISVAGQATSTNATGTADVPNTISYMISANRFTAGVKGLPAACSIWGGLGKAKTSGAEVSGAEVSGGAFHFAGREDHTELASIIVGGTIGLTRSGTPLNAHTQTLIVVDKIAQGPTVSQPDVTIDSVAIAGARNELLYATRFDHLMLTNTRWSGNDTCRTGIKIVGAPSKKEARGQFFMEESFIRNCKKGLIIGDSTRSPLERACLSNNKLGTDDAGTKALPNNYNVVVCNTEEFTSLRDQFSAAKVGNGLTINEGTLHATITESITGALLGGNSALGNAGDGVYINNTDAIEPTTFIGGSSQLNGQTGHRVGYRVSCFCDTRYTVALNKHANFLVESD